jgi:Spy/CpxP family protein refolding chaperone
MSRRVIAVMTLALLVLIPVGWAHSAGPAPAAHDEIGRLFDEMASRLRGLGSQLREGWGHHEGRGERPLITLMLKRRDDLGLTPEQVRALESLRSDFQREAIRKEADIRVAEMDLEALLEADSVEMGKVEAKVREIERFRADLRLARLGVIERGKAQLTQDQRAKLKKLLTEPRSWRPHSQANRSHTP